MHEPGTGPAPAAAARNSDPLACYVIQGASRGLGLEMCRLLLARTAGTVVATCRNPDGPTADGLRALQQTSAGRLQRCVSRQLSGLAALRCGHPGLVGLWLRVRPVCVCVCVCQCSVAYDPEHADEDTAAATASAIGGFGGGRVDLLVNAAGMLHDTAAGNMPEKALRLVKLTVRASTAASCLHVALVSVLR